MQPIAVPITVGGEKTADQRLLGFVALGIDREGGDVLAAAACRRNPGLSAAINLIDADDAMDGQMGLADAFELALQLFFGRIEHDGGLFTEHELLDLQETVEIAAPNRTGEDLIDLPL